MVLGEQGPDGSYLRDDDDDVDDSAGVVASQLLIKEDRNYHLPEAIRNYRLYSTQTYIVAGSSSSCKWLNNANSFLAI